MCLTTRPAAPEPASRGPQQVCEAEGSKKSEGGGFGGCWGCVRPALAGLALSALCSSSACFARAPPTGLRIVDIEAIFGDDPIQVWDCSGDKQ